LFYFLNRENGLNVDAHEFYAKHARGFLICYDPFDKYTGVESIKQQCKELSKTSANIVIAALTRGPKKDDGDTKTQKDGGDDEDEDEGGNSEPKITSAAGRALAKSLGCEFVEVDVLDKAQVIKCIDLLVNGLGKHKPAAESKEDSDDSSGE
jgi:hypothetical protein